ncbi:GerAB/ArcD/ProY family transporter [Faecalispora anaeroviscerum]|uniref:GerAB/ArcD/ProY family transporter n=1 Tax=Faecalispora anaeroviscerum TaxID=2991836 RepID=UPI0024BA5C87|nr:endospore germination permease [Faecalispora anaeroviscerum]
MKTIQDCPLTSREMILMIILFTFGSSVVIGVNASTKQDSWICLLIGAAISLPVYILYARIIQLMDGQDFFTSILSWFGEIPGRIVISVFVWYCLHLAAVVLRNFTEFMEIVAMPETPQIPIMISLLLVSAYLCKSRIQVIGQWSVVGLYVTSIIVIVTVLSTTSYMQPQNLLPILEHSTPEIMKSSYQIFSFPYAECVILLPLISAIKRANPYKIFLNGLFFSTLVLLVVVLRNILCLGAQLMEAEYFPSYSCARIMEVGNFLSRIEGSISVNFIVAGLTKITVCLYSGTLGAAKILKASNKLDLIIMPIFMFTLMLCAISYDDAVQMFDFVEVYPLYALPFQIILPLVIWLTGEWRTRSQKLTSSPTTQQAT